MYPAVYYVDRSTGTSADTLLAFGLADVIARLIPEDQDWELGIEATESGYRINMKEGLPASWVDHASFFSSLQGLKTAKKEPELPAALVVDYVEHKQRNDAYFEAVRKKATADVLKEQGLEPPHPNWSVWAVINQMSAAGALNDLVVTWYAHRDCFPTLLRLLLQLYCVQPNPLAEVEVAWKVMAKAHKVEARAEIPMLQVTNPGMGKGNNRSKAAYSQPNGLQGFWLPEYLKYGGLLQAAIVRTVSGSKDRKTYVVRPQNLTWATHRKVFPEFQKSLWPQSAIKMDVLAALRYARVFVEQWRDGLAEGRLARLRSGRPGDHVAGLETIFYKYLGSAYATLNLSTLALPQWLRQIDTREDAAQYLSLLEEHDKVVRSLNMDAKGKEKEKGDENALLQEYRYFLSAGDLRAFLRFAQGYSTVLMRRLGARVYVPQFTLANLEVLIMAHNDKLIPILRNAGFQRVAKAIRQSTVTPQYFKAKGEAGPYEVRYGLGTELMRQAADRDKFVQALSKFLQAYSQETGQINERYKGTPPVRRVNISTKDVDQLIALIDEYDPETVGGLLVAYGYAREAKVDELAEPGAEATPELADASNMDDSQDE